MGTPRGIHGEPGNMTKGVNRLPASYQKLKKPGLHNDGNCLYLQVSIGPHGNVRRSWIFRYQLSGRKAHDMGLGGASYISLGEARELARKYRQLAKAGVDPIAHRNAEVAKNLAASAAPAMTFDEATAVYFRQHRAEWTNVRHAADWSATMKRYASPAIGGLSIADITTAHIMKILDPIWLERTETAKRLRGRIEAVLGWATVSGYRSGDNPARWRDHLDNLLASPAKAHVVRHMTALPVDQMPTFVAELRERAGMGALVLEFLILTCVRTADVLNARVADVDTTKRVWTIPKFSKTFKEHRVPLSDAAIAAIEKVRRYTHDIGGAVGKSRFLFPNDVTGARLSKNATFQLIDRMGRKGTVSAHGCRATFRTWTQERTAGPREVAEQALGHTIGSAVERSYARSDLFEKRAVLMQAWADFCARPKAPADVVPLRRRSKP